MEARNAEKREVTKILRSLIISSPEKGKSLKTLCKDFYEFEGKRIPTFEYKSIEDFLRGTREFIFEHYRGELIIYVEPSPQSHHISKLVAEQGRPKRRPVAGRLSRAREPHQLQPRPIYSTSSFRSPAKTIIPIKTSTEAKVFSFEQLKMQHNSVQNRLAINITNQKTSSLNNNSNSQNSQNKTTQPTESIDLRNRLNELRQIKDIVDLTIDDPVNTQTSRNVKPIPPNTAPAPPSSLHRQPEKAPTCAPPNIPIHPLLPSNPFFEDAKPAQQSQLNQTQDRIPPSYIAHNKMNFQSVMNDVSVTEKKRKSVNDRLVQARLVVQTSPTTPNLSNVNINTNSGSPSTYTKSQEPFQWKTAPSSPNVQHSQLIEYCRINDLGEPKFKTFPMNNRYHCYVMVDNIRYSAYPAEYADREEAISETAKYALDRLLQVKSQQEYEVCYDSEADLIIKIYDCVKDPPIGVFTRNIPGKFREQYQQLLPPHWMKLLAKHPEFFTIDDSVDDQIVSVVESAELDHKMDKLQLPWDEEYWCLFISHTVSTSEIYGRLVGEHHSHALDALVTDIELDLIKNKRKPEVLNIGQLYLVVKCECAYRVRIEKIDAAELKSFCYYVDEGDRLWLDNDELYICHTKFMKFPPQAIRLSLYGLEDYNENDFAVRHLEETLLNRAPLVGRIFTKKDDFISHEESPDLEPIVEVVLYDTTTADDINLHPVIEEKICRDMPHPKLLPDLTAVFVSHISDNGDIFCQLRESGLHYINKLIRKFTLPDTTIHRTVELINNDSKKLFLVFDEKMREWCRAKLISESKVGNKMFLIDYGNTQIVPLSKIYSLDTLSKALSTFPPQAIQVKLSGFDDLPADLVSTLRGYFSGGANAYVAVDKESVPGFIPKAKLYYVKDDCIVNVHDCIKADLDRYQTNVASLSRQGSVTSNTGTNVRASEESPKIDNLTRPPAQCFGTKLPKFEAPEINTYFDHIVVFAATPSNFKIRPIKYMPQWVEQMTRLQKYCRNSRETLPSQMIRKGEAYACLYSDGSWQRAIIVEMYSLSKICVFFCDNGDIDEIDDVTKLKWLPEEFRTIPKLGLTAKLSGIKPINGDWEMHDITWFSRLVTGKKYQAIVDNVTVDSENPDNNAVLEIRLIDVSTDIDVCINDEFVKQRRATYNFNR